MAKVRDKLYVTVPSLFRCPISMDVMRSPVSLCTGVTYDRSSIQRWLESGHDTCPATMQILPSKDFIPNLTLHRLIRLWLLSAAGEPSSPSETRISAASDRLRALLAGIQTDAEDFAASLSELAEFSRFSAENRRVLVSFPGFDSAITRALAGSRSRIEASENVIAVLDLVLRENGSSDSGVLERIRRSILDCREDCLAAIAFALENGSAKSKVASVRVLEFLAGDFQSKRWIAETRGLLSQLVKLLYDGTEELNGAVLSLLASVSVTQSAKAELVRSEIVKALSKTLQSAASSGSMAEKCLKMLAVVATCADGRAAMGGDLSCAAGVVERLAKAGKAATEDAVAVLWSLCCLCGNEKVRDEVAKRNGVAVVLLVMQRGCEGHVRSMCVDLIKVLRKNGLPLPLKLSYDTQTTHIKPC
ncbi:hypothetical protein HN51_071764 [Arachis hypogaea]|uniref:U-box domain-containing protein n=1 Tax=Arachis hypogaea TaxID=3818 RepID=A0A444YX88_ARAHY|nr:U-box domain-containing protein 28 [Arachis ipaensis]XP_025656979.1 U-box domain-containing protein 28 [Arachis hypogaea]QHO14388.1 U-box domain-containing protein [Arachis hypogaea]RYR06533.1 hypothetical protein Ahy_B05g073860 [Arachis hypogaea]